MYKIIVNIEIPPSSLWIHAHRNACRPRFLSWQAESASHLASVTEAWSGGAAHRYLGVHLEFFNIVHFKYFVICIYFIFLVLKPDYKDWDIKWPDDLSIIF